MGFASIRHRPMLRGLLFDAKGGIYSVFALEQSLLFDRPPPQSIIIDGKYLQLESSAGAWAQYGNVGLAPGSISSYGFLIWI